MHQSSYAFMEHFARTLPERFARRPVRVLDVGSAGINGTYKDLFRFEGAQYVGLDIQPGPNVDVVPDSPYAWDKLADESFDVVISGQAIEHVEFPWLVFEQIARKLKPGGIACLIAPSRGPEHRFPVDCYRYYPDGLRALAKWSGLKVLECDYVKSSSGFGADSDQWGDCRCILAKPVSKTSEPAVEALNRSAPQANGEHRSNPLSLSAKGYFEYARPEVVQLIQQQRIQGTRILELGCAAGVMAKEIIRLLSPERYVGIEMDSAAADRARAHIGEVHVANLDAATPEALGLRPGMFDLLLALDVLEHLYNPWDVLERYSRLLAPGGVAVLSIPNIANVSIIQQLAQGKWQYQALGLLDATHLRFFSADGVRELVTGAGLTVAHVAFVLNPQPDMTQLRDVGNDINLGGVQISNLSRSQVINLCTFQFLVIARKPAAA